MTVVEVPRSWRQDAAPTGHANPGEATLYVLPGRVLLAADDQTREGRGGDVLIVPGGAHSLQAQQDSTVLPTVAKRP
jgi:quercetin dioxygenase-like cupin family protein